MEFVKKNQKVILLGGVIIILVLLAMYFRSENKNKESFQTASTFYFFNVAWCGHCKNAKPEWDKLVKSKKAKATGIKLVSIDAEDEQNKQLVEKYNIESFPTFILKKSDGNTVEYNDERTMKNMLSFLQAHS